MNSIKSSNFPINWYEGMALRSFHLQQGDIYHINLISELNTLQSYYWGFDQLQLNPIKLTAGIISIVGGNVIFPNGEMFFDLSNYNIKDYIIENNNTSKLLYLAMKINQSEKYETISENVEDINIPENQQIVQKLRRKMFIIPEDKMTGQHIGVPLISISSRINNNYDFYPPCVKVRKNDIIYNKSILFCASLRESLSFFLWYEKNKSSGPELRTAFNIIVSDLIELELILESETHPFNIFKLLGRIIGTLNFLNNTIYQAISYNHFNLEKSFQEVFELLAEVLNNLHIRSTYVDLKLNNKVLELEWSDNIVKNNKIQIIVSCYTDIQVQQVYNEVNDLQIYSESLEDHVSSRRIIGAPRVVDNSLEECYKKKTVSFTISIEDNYLKKDEKIIIKGIYIIQNKVYTRI